VREADIINAQFEVLPVLHDRHRVRHHVELVRESAFKLLLVCDEDTVAEDTPLP